MIKSKLRASDESSEFAENIINTVREPLIVLDKDLRVVKASRSFYEFFKVTSNETIGTLIYDLGNHQWDIPKLRELLETILPQKTAFDNYEVEHNFATIGKRIMLLNARKIQGGFGVKKLIILLTIEDITERKEIEKGLEKTRKELVVIKEAADEVSTFSENLINTVREPLIALNQDLRVVKASRSFYEFFKVTSDETIGTLIYDLGDGQWNIPKLRELLETILPQKTTFDNYEVEHNFTTIGKRIMLLNARQILRGSGKERIILLAIEDITKRKEVEESHRLLYTQLEVSNKELEAFGYSVSHDLRAPLRHIEGFIELLKNKIIETADDSVKHYLNIISQASKKLSRLIDELLAYSRTGRTKLILKEVDLNELVKEVITELMPQMEDRKIIWQIDQLPRIQADYNLIKLVYQNLIGNSIKFTRHKDEAIVWLTAKEEEEKRYILIVKDNGVGFDMAFSERLFSVFQRLHSEQEFEGIGIGLANVRRIVQMHSGDIWAEAKVNEGAQFSFTIPKIIRQRIQYAIE